MRLQQKTADDFLLPEASAFLHVCFFNFLPTCDTDACVCLVLQLPACPIADCARGERACITIILMLTDLGGCKVGQGAVWQGISLEHSLHAHIPNQTESGFLVWGMSEMRLHGLVEC